MTKLPRDLKPKKIIKALEKAGFVARPHNGQSLHSYQRRLAGGRSVS
jgi:predicted RNA binding protein YcfA (HicA-like mRNA interferase family)